jgi:hypothetical protein
MKAIRPMFLLLLCGAMGLPLAAQVTVRNIVPLAQSGETNQDSEPNIAVNLANPQQIAASAFTPDPGGSATLSPIFVSTDGGTTWTMNNVVPSVGGTGDITLRFGGTSNVLYTGILKKPFGLRLNILRKPVFSNTTAMDVLIDRTNIDQPYVAAATVSGGAGFGEDRVYVGHNDFGASSGKTATVELSTNAATAPAPAGFTARRIEPRTTNGQDLPPIRPVVHLDGTIYAAYYGWRSGSPVLNSDVVVVRDDTWASSGSPFGNLLGADTSAGFIVAANVRVPFDSNSQPAFGQERFVASNISIAVDPRDSNTVWVAWADYPTATSTTYTLHVRRSTTRGTTWSGDLLTVSGATNPALAVNSHGRLGFAYQQLTGSGSTQRWQTHFRRTDDGTTWNDVTLSNTPANTPAFTFTPYIGDYIHVMAVGKDFYGIFSANNTPDPANFPSGVIWQRNVDTGTLALRNLSNTADVAVSIDPFFFRVTDVEPSNDFYVADWNSSITVRDTGVEPSTNPVFFATSDVWNRRSPTTGSFPGGAPDNENAGNGVGLIGKNYSFARIRRNATASASATVTAHFLVSRFGTGSNYIDANDDAVSFPNPDPTITFAPGDLEAITAPWEWQLPAVASTHLCLAVEISAAGDPYVAPTLRGNTPGWPTTDLRILNDNNKAQRNMGLSTTPATGASGTSTYYALIHNAATVTRDMRLTWTTEGRHHQRLKMLSLETIGGEGRRRLEPKGSIVLDAMRPGEDRWIAIHFVPPSGEPGEIVAVNFFEMEQGVAVNGFAIGAKLATDREVFADTLTLHRSVLTRLRYFNVPGADEQGALADRLGRDVSADRYAEVARTFIAWYERSARDIPTIAGKGLASANAKSLREAINGGRPLEAAVAHTSLLNDLDTQLTMVELSGGNAADVLQTVRWQSALIARDPRLRSCAALQTGAAEFITSYQQRQAGAGEYERFLGESLPCLQRAGGLNPVPMRAMPGGQFETAALQKQHREILLALEASAPK